MSTAQTQTKSATKAPPAAVAAAAKKAAKTKAAKRPAKKTASNGSKPSPKKTPAKKNSSKPSSTTSKKKPNGKATTVAKAGKAPTKDPKKGGDLPEKDLNRICKEISDIYQKKECIDIDATFEAGKRLVKLQTAGVPKGKLNHLFQTKIVDIAGKPLSKSWIAKARRRYRTLKNCPKRAQKVGLKKLDLLYKLPEETVKDILTNGIVTKKNAAGKPVEVTMPEDLTCSQIEVIVEKHKASTDTSTPEKNVVKAVKKIAHACQKILIEHSEVIKRGKFSKDLGREFKAAVSAIRGFPKSLSELRPKKAVEKKAPKKKAPTKK